jgi:hypothetical protein
MDLHLIWGLRLAKPIRFHVIDWLANTFGLTITTWLASIFGFTYQVGLHYSEALQKSIRLALR